MNLISIYNIADINQKDSKSPLKPSFPNIPANTHLAESTVLCILDVRILKKLSQINPFTNKSDWHLISLKVTSHLHRYPLVKNLYAC